MRRKNLKELMMQEESEESSSSSLLATDSTMIEHVSGSQLARSDLSVGQGLVTKVSLRSVNEQDISQQQDEQGQAGEEAIVKQQHRREDELNDEGDADMQSASQQAESVSS